MPATAEELMAQVHNLYAALLQKRSFNRYREHVQKLNVDAGDHCLYTSKVEKGRSRTVTSISAVVSCTDITNITLARGFMHNIFEVKREPTPGDNLTTKQEGLWILGPGEYMQSCFDDVPAGCDLHLYANGSYRAFPSMYEVLPQPQVPQPEPEIEGYLWAMDADNDKMLKLDPITGATLASYDAPDTDVSGVTNDGLYLWVAGRTNDKIYKVDPSDGSTVSSITPGVADPDGVTFAKGFLYALYAGAANIKKMDPSDGSVLATYDVVTNDWAGIAWDGVNIRLAENALQRIYKFDLATESFLSWFASPADWPTGLAFDGRWLWVSTILGANSTVYMVNPVDGTIYHTFAKSSTDIQGVCWQPTTTSIPLA